MKIYKLIAMFTAVLWVLMGASAKADLDLVVDKSGEGAAIKLLIAPFGASPFGGKMRSIITADLQRSGRFIIVDPAAAGNISPFGGKVDPQQLQQSGAEFLLRGRALLRDGREDLIVEIIDASDGNKTAGFVTSWQPEQRGIAHKTADAIFRQLTGVRGAFDTRIAYVAASGSGDDRIYQLIVADSDGYNDHAVVTSMEPIMSISWSPDGKQLAYVSFESGKPAIYIQNLASGERRLISARKGINGAPAWSRDGRKLAVSLSLEGNPEIYTIDIGSGQLTRITQSRAIDTEPSWSGDGREIIFTSDRGGSPQLYRIPAQAENSTQAQRITFEGNYNSAADVVDGKVALVRQIGGKFHVLLMDLASRQSDIISKGGLDESPSLAPNGAMVLYETSAAGSGHTLAVASDNGRSNTFLHLPYADVGHPAWSPFLY